jgi:endonuclease-3
MRGTGTGGNGRKQAGKEAKTQRPAKGSKRRPRSRSRLFPPVPARSRLIFDRLNAAYPDAKCALDHGSAFELIVATILSAQCTDTRVNMVTPVLFSKYPDAFALARAKQSEVEEIIKSTGFFRNKAKSLIGMAQALVAAHQGEVPRTMDELRILPGVGRKTANVVLGNAFGINEGITVDTHVTRLSLLLGLTKHDDPIRIEQDLMKLFPQKSWALLSHLLIFHGRQVCIARRPRCAECVVADLCPSAAFA